MSFKVISLLALAIPALCHGFLLRDQSHWNGLEVTWGVNPFSSFTGMPRTQKDAVHGGWSLMMPGQTGCTDNPKFLGTRFWKDNDKAVILIYDSAGYIAGIQAGIPKGYSPNPNNFPNPGLQQKAMVLDGDTYYITAYFVNPATLCNGRSKSEFDTQGTGTGLWIQNGTNPVTQSVQMPATKTEADGSLWTKGSCFISMGLHYWYNLDLNMSCDNFFPVFLLYNEGKLNAFGWAFLLDITTSKRIEHPPQSSYGTFMNPPPTCLSSAGTLSTLHIYLTNSARADLC